MNQEERLKDRSGNFCELCNATEGLKVYEVPPATGNMEDAILVCPKCMAQIEKKEELDSTHWQCLSTSMWSGIPAVQVVSWRMLSDEQLAWAKQSGDHENDSSVELHRDCYGAILLQGDNVVLTKSLDVKGSTVNAKVGTVVRNIRLVSGNTEQIEGRIEGQQIVILTKYLRKQG